MVFVPPEFAVPRGLSTPLFELSVLAPRHAEADYDAVMSSRPRLQRYQGRGRRKLGANESSALDLGDTWPAATMTLDYNRTDLVEHEEEFAQRLAFAFTVFSVEEPDRCVGCVYINPSQKPAHDAQVVLWMRDSHAHLDGELYASVKTWLTASGEWSGAGWGSLGWPGREQSFDEWEALESLPAEDYAKLRLQHFGGSVAAPAQPKL
jgi:hypothetical protein